MVAVTKEPKNMLFIINNQIDIQAKITYLPTCIEKNTLRLVIFGKFNNLTAFCSFFLCEWLALPRRLSLAYNISQIRQNFTDPFHQACLTTKAGSMQMSFL